MSEPKNIYFTNLFLPFVSPSIRRLSGGPGQSAVKCNQLSKADPKLADLMIFQLPLKRGITSLSIYWLVGPNTKPDRLSQKLSYK